MSIARKLLLKASKSPFLNEQVSHRPFVKRAVKRFMPGESPAEAITAALALAAEGRGTVFTKLGENLTSLDDAQAVRDHYLGFFDQLRQRNVPGHVSVKPTQLGLDLSEEVCARYCEELAQKADESGTYFWLDMEDSSYVDRTLDLYRALRAKHEHVGVAIQAYLRRTPDDVRELLRINPTIRLVKGAYAEPSELAFPLKADTDRAYYDIASMMLEATANQSCTAIFGTHDIPLVRRLISRAHELGVADGQYEVHMLYGIRDGDQRRLRAEGRTIRTLISYGASWFPWYMRRLAERPANMWFVVRSMLPG